MGDFDGDGRKDLAIANSDSNDVSILPGDGNGTFRAATSYDAGAGPFSLAAGDFNNDGKPDLVVADRYSTDNVITLLLGNGDGTFEAGGSFPAGEGAISVAVADFNSDDKSDVVVVNSVANTVSILLGDAAGTFAAAFRYSVGSAPRSVVVADFDGDSNMDVAVANEDSDDVSVLLGSGDGTFGAAMTSATGDAPVSITTADFNGDGKSDLATNGWPDKVSVLLGKGNGTFGSVLNYFVGSAPVSVVAGDFDGDAQPDLAVANSGSNNVSVLFGNGNGTFGEASNYEVGFSPTSIAMGDFNADGRIDLVAANDGSSTVSFLLNSSTCASISSIVLNAGPTAGGQSVTINGTHLSGALAITFDGTAATITTNTATSIKVTTPAHAATDVDVSVATAGGIATSIRGYAYLDAPSTPTGLSATLVSATRVDLVWTNVTAATTYEIDRRQSGAGFVLISITPTNGFSDTTASAGTAYLYRVRAVNSGVPSSSSAPVLVTTLFFADDPLAAGYFVRALHLSELRTAINAVRSLANLTPITFTDSATSGTTIKAVHVTELRSALTEARMTLGFSTPAYTDATLSGLFVTTVHFQELRTAAGTTPPQFPSHIVVNEVLTGTSGSANDEFIELFNGGPAYVNVSDFKVVYRSASGTSDILLVTIPAGTIIAGGGYYLLGSNTYIGPPAPDQSFATNLAAAGGGVAIRDAATGNVMDSVGWGTATNAFVEGTPAVAPAPGMTIGRTPNGVDTNNNAADFAASTAVSPKASNP